MKMKSAYPVTAVGIRKTVEDRTSNCTKNRAVTYLDRFKRSDTTQNLYRALRWVAVRSLLSLSSALFLAWAAPVAAEKMDHEQVLQLKERGELLPLKVVLQRHRDRLWGRLIDLELEHQQGRWVYELELIDPRGVVLEYRIDAKSGEWLGQE